MSPKGTMTCAICVIGLTSFSSAVAARNYGYQYNPVQAASWFALNAQLSGSPPMDFGTVVIRHKVNRQLLIRQRQRRRAAMQAKIKPPAPARARQLNVFRVPTPLTPDELRPAGDVRWPDALQDDRFTDERLTLQTYFAAKDQLGAGVDPEIVQLANEAVLSMMAELQQEIRDLSTADYLAARKFIDGLNLAIIQPPGD
ncbi:MAG: hypothetical protein AB7O68_04520 [Pirellulales bacterium]